MARWESKGSESSALSTITVAIAMSADRENRVVIVCLLLVVATLAFYNPIVHNQFIDYDDLSYIQRNNHVVGGLSWEDVKWAFTTSRDGNWHPLTWMSHALDCQIFGLNPLGHHYTNLLFHAANAVLLFLLLVRATGFTWSSLFVAALFALHPVNVESVVWAAERKNVLSMFFFLLTLHAYDRFARRGGGYRYLLAAALFALGLMAKSQIVTLPFVLLLWDYWPLQRMGAPGDLPAAATSRSFAYLVWEKLPFFFLAAADSIITVLAQRAGDSVRTLAEVPMSVRLGNVLASYVRYVGKAFWPARLAPMYPRPAGALHVWQWVGAVVILLLVSAMVLRWRHQRYLPFGWFWFLGTLVPMIGIITVGEQAMADRYAYIPFIGLFVAVVWSIDELVSRRRIPSLWPASAAVVVALLLGCLTYRQVGYWRDGETLWRHTLRVTERNYVAHNNLAIALAGQGKSEDAIMQFRASKALHKFVPTQDLALASFELQAGHPELAIEECNAVLHDAVEPPNPLTLSHTKDQSTAWSGLGQAYLQLHRYDQAAAGYEKALRLNSEDSRALVGTGLLALRVGQDDAAVTQLLHAVRVEPSDARVLLYAQALRRAGRSAEADSAEAQVRKISSDLGRAQFEAGQMLSFAGLRPL